MKSSPKKYVTVIFCALICLSLLLSGCAGNAASDAGAADENAAAGDGAAAEKSEIQYGYFAFNSEPLTNWDPSVEFSNGIVVMNNMYEQLLRYDPIKDEISPLLATEYEVSEDGLTWTFKLREGVKFHDGTDFNADAVKFSIERTLRLGEGAAYIWDAVEEINVIDDYTVEFKLSYATPLDLVATTGYAAFIYSPSSVGDNDDWFQDGKEAGTGPYKLKSFKWGDEIVMEKFDDYWGGWSDSNLPTVVIKKISETTTRRQMIEKGEASVTFELPYSDIDALKEDSNVVVREEPSFQNLLAMFNTQKEPLNDVKVRQALSYAFPYDDVINYAMGGYATQATGPVPSGMWGHSDELPQYSYDLDKAKSLLEEAGYADGFSLLATYMSGDEAEKSTAELYKAELAKLNIDMEIRGMPWDSQWELSKNPDPNERQDIFFFYWWPDLPSPYSFLYSPYHSEEEILFNLSYYYNDEFDALIDQANEITSTDRDQATQLFVDAQKMLIDDAISIFAYDKEAVWITRSDFQGFSPNPAYPTTIFFYETSLGAE